MFIMIYLQKYINTIAANKAGKIVFLLREIIKLELAKYYKVSEMTAYISERSRNSK